MKAYALLFGLVLAEPRARAVTYWGRAIGAGHLHDTAAARDAVAQFDGMVEAVRKGDHAYRAKYMETNRDEPGRGCPSAKGRTTMP